MSKYNKILIALYAVLLYYVWFTKIDIYLLQICFTCLVFLNLYFDIILQKEGGTKK